MKVCHCTLYITNPSACLTCTQREDFAPTRQLPYTTGDHIQPGDPIKTFHWNDNRSERIIQLENELNLLRYRAQVLETENKKVKELEAHIERQNDIIKQLQTEKQYAEELLLKAQRRFR